MQFIFVGASFKVFLRGDGVNRPRIDRDKSLLNWDFRRS